MVPSSELKARILDAARREPSATLPRAVKQTALAIVAIIVVDIGLFVLVGGVHRGARPNWFFLVTQGGAFLVALLAAWGAFGRGRSMLGRRPRTLLHIALGTPILLFSWMLFWDTWCPETATLPGRVGLRCVALSLASAAWPLALIAWVRRERIPIRPAVTGAARGAAIGAFAWVLVAMWCPLTYPAHVAFGHVLPLLISSGFGAWLGKRMTGVTQVRLRRRKK